MAPRGSQQKQIGVALPDEVRARVEAAANKAGHSIAQEIRQRLERTFKEEAIDPETGKLLDTIALLAHLVKIQTGHDWFSHPAAASILKLAIDERLARTKGGDGQAVFSSDELLPRETRYLATISDDPRVIASILAGIAHFWVKRVHVFGKDIIKNMTEEEVRKFMAEDN